MIGGYRGSHQMITKHKKNWETAIMQKNKKFAKPPKFL